MHAAPPVRMILGPEPAWAAFMAAVRGFLQPAVAQAEPAGADSLDEPLTPREREVLDLVARGVDNAGIAEALHLSGKTVRNHVSHLYDKLHVASRAAAVVRARECGFGRLGRHAG